MCVSVCVLLKKTVAIEEVEIETTFVIRKLDLFDMFLVGGNMDV